MVVLCGTVCTVVGAGLADFFRDERPRMAWQNSRLLAMQIAEKQDSVQLSNAAPQADATDRRAPASVNASSAQANEVAIANAGALVDGEIGNDPWSHPYHYRTFTSATAGHSIVYVWSSGPNGRSESRPSAKDDSRLFRFSGDDVGYVHEVIHK